MMTNEMCAAAVTSVNKVWLEIKIMSEFKVFGLWFSASVTRPERRKDEVKSSRGSDHHKVKSYFGNIILEDSGWKCSGGAQLQLCEGGVQPERNLAQV